jgi:hypothetical protein
MKPFQAIYRLFNSRFYIPVFGFYNLGQSRLKPGPDGVFDGVMLHFDDGFGHMFVDNFQHVPPAFRRGQPVVEVLARKTLELARQPILGCEGFQYAAFLRIVGHGAVVVSIPGILTVVEAKIDPADSPRFA